MRALVQRVLHCSVRVTGRIVGRIEAGLLVLLAVHQEDGEHDLQLMKRKLLGLRIFEDDEGKMNRSVQEAGGAFLVVSQFTLYGDCRKGNRPSFSRSASPHQARALYEKLISELRAEGLQVEAGEFQARMEVTLLNDGPVTLIIDTHKEFY